MFLTRGPIPTEPIWRAFLGVGHPRGSWQHLFPLYVHPPPGYTYPPGSLFEGREVEDRVVVEWGQHTLVSRGHQRF